MSKPISEEEYRKSMANRLKQWILGEEDPYLGNMESQPQQDLGPSQKVLTRHK